MSDMTRDEALREVREALEIDEAVRMMVSRAALEALSRPAPAPRSAEVDHKRLWRLTGELRPLLQSYGRCWERQAPHTEAERSGSPMEALEEDLDQYERPIIKKVDALITAERDRQADELREMREGLERIACRHVTAAPLWWQAEARALLKETGS